MPRGDRRLERQRQPHVDMRAKAKRQFALSTEWDRVSTRGIESIYPLYHLQRPWTTTDKNQVRGIVTTPRGFRDRLHYLLQTIDNLKTRHLANSLRQSPLNPLGVVTTLGTWFLSVVVYGPCCRCRREAFGRLPLKLSFVNDERGNCSRCF